MPPLVIRRRGNLIVLGKPDPLAGVYNLGPLVVAEPIGEWGHLALAIYTA